MLVKRQKAFTLIEILIASSILSMFMFTSYKLYFGVSKSFQKGSWSLNAQNKVRNALTFIREEMQKASFKTQVTMTGVVGDETANPFELNSASELTSGIIAKWYICIPFVSHDAGSGAVYQCELKLNGGKLIYSKGLIEGSDPESHENAVTNKVILKNVSKIKLASEVFDPDKTVSGNVVEMEIEVRHPDAARFGNTHVVAKTGAKVEMAVVNL